MENISYAKAAKVLDIIWNKQISFKNAIYNYSDVQNDKNFKKIYKLVIEVLRNKYIIDEVCDSFYKDVPVLETCLFKVLIYERFLSNYKKLKMGGRLVKFLKSKESEVDEYLVKGGYVEVMEEVSGKQVGEKNKNILSGSGTLDGLGKNSFENYMYFRVNTQKNRKVFSDS